MGIISTGQQWVDLYDKTISKVFDDELGLLSKLEPPVFDKVFQVLNSKDAYEKLSGLAGTGIMTTKSEGGVAGEGTMKQKYDKTFTHATYSMFTRISKEAQDDDRTGLLMNIPKYQARSATYSVENAASTVINNAFATTGADGKVLCASDHPRVGDGGTWSNLATGALSYTNLSALRLKMRKTVNDYGYPQPQRLSKLLVPADLEASAEQYVYNPNESDTALRNINAVSRLNKIEIIVWDWLTSATAYFGMTDKELRQFFFYWREKINREMHPLTDTTRDVYHQTSTRFSCGYVDARGFAGSTGA